MADPPAGTGGKPRRMRNWEAISAIIALLGLIAALIFNGIQAADSADAQRQTQHATELSQQATELTLLTQLQSMLNDSVYARTPYASQFQALRAGRLNKLAAQPYQAVVREASDMDYLAWLFNQGYLAVPGADRLWGPLMVCEFKNAIYPALGHATQDFPNLSRFIDHRGANLERGAPPCNQSQ